jgi:nicotinate-nucleotide pyrophosphorylase (carboxylating)
MTALEGHIRRWLEEDLGPGDVTSMATIPDGHESRGIIHSKESGIVAGIPVAKAVFHAVDPSLRFHAKVADGDEIGRGTVLAEVEGATRSILSAERLALNLLQRMSGIATRTRQFVDAVEGFSAHIADTRKTTPGHRLLEKYAVRVGGGTNHRFGLFDAVLIKDNHIKASGSIGQAVQAARRAVPHTMKIEVEVETFEQLEEALEAKADIIMLDNMSADRMKEAVKRIRSVSPHVLVEASGGVTLERVREIAAAGVDIISVGALTHTIQALDISLDIHGKKEHAI